ncbi:hypothetical protein WOLCODRAFT_113020 [Wolfiporia cocos MD-104 SS10]|uniref:CSC1/OSCA1-like 7TM region domain-containing protein n=1 Tax=Wolfiporia cocos (strain MD-104) TaxID=742152 RepID=A0A2H3J5J4_WOLCO|nr:hypothetical protein WOLCODRAFT_113020 [Wolfiporia cocos MD-104 SS10]
MDSSGLPARLLSQSAHTARSLGEPSMAYSARAPTLDQPVCIGHGLDVPALGVLSTLVLPTVIGLCIWLLFAIFRPRYRQVYGLREWFVRQGLRPKPLDHSLFAFLSPPVPLKPSLLDDASLVGRSPARNAQLFPSDEELSQRTLWASILVVSGWSFLGLAGLLPLYMVSTPCMARSARPFQYGGQFSTLQDLSLLRLLYLLPTDDTEIYAVFDTPPYVRIRLIILTIFAIVLALLPALWLILREFNNLVAYRERWVSMRCQNVELGWLSASQAPGFTRWGEKRLKEFLTKTGLSSYQETNDGANSSGNGHGQSSRRQRQGANQDTSQAEKGSLEIDIASLFSIGDTTQLAHLIEERDEILEKLEVAETKYIQSFRLSTPDPSVADFDPPLPTIEEDPDRPYISRPLPLAPASRRKRRRGHNPAVGSSSLPPPTSYVMPSQYYKLNRISGVNGGHFADVRSNSSSSTRQGEPSLSDSFNQRVVGSRFQEVHSDSHTIEQIPMGSQVAVNKSGQLEAIRTPISELGEWNPDMHASWSTAAPPENDTFPYNLYIPHGSQDHILQETEESWHDVSKEDPEAFQNAEEYSQKARRRSRPPKATNGINAGLESFPLRLRNIANQGVPASQTPLQPRQPFVRPVSGVDQDALGRYYEEINTCRLSLKAYNAQIADLQRESYSDIADGAHIKGWLLVGRGLRFIPGVQLIEGRAKEDIRWDELQHSGSYLRTLSFWTFVLTISIMLAVFFVAVVGLFLSTAPDFAHYYPFLMPLEEENQLGAGIATYLCSALAATIVISFVLKMIHSAAQLMRSISLSGSQMLIFKTIFYVLTIVGGISLFIAGALLFAMHSFSIHIGDAASVADGIIYMSVFAMVLILTVALILPGLLLLQPARLWRVVRAEKEAITSRQRFRAVYPRTYNPSYALSGPVLAFAYASSFTLLFPLVAPAALLLLVLTTIAHRFLVGYVYGRTHSSTGGLLQIWLLRRLGTVLAFQPLILGLIFLSRMLWIEGGILCGSALFVFVFVECYCEWRTRQPGRKSLSPVTLDSLDTFIQTAGPKSSHNMVEDVEAISSGRNTRTRGSYASILDMLSTLAVVPSPSETRGPIPATENLDDLTATERAARTHPDAPPHLPPLPFADHAEEVAGILYAPELLAPPPTIWLPNDMGGIARSEAADLEQYHDLRVTLDVRGKDDTASRRSWSSQTRRAQASGSS